MQIRAGGMGEMIGGSDQNKSILRRYTTLPALLQLLRNRKITLLNPETWEDKNDVCYMQRFKEVKKLTSVLALCFSEAQETFHHWRVFANGSDGVCIEFRRKDLLAAFGKVKDVRKGSVLYKTIPQLRASPPAPSQLPFIKRQPYRHEREFRLVYLGFGTPIKFKEFDINLNCIQRITLGPLLLDPLVDSVRSTIRAIRGCARIEICKTTILGNNDFMNAARKMN
jgi:hypothetical protein